jgi:hypothetical protein
MPPTSPPRRRGAPLGNLNNFKHGFYSRRLKKRDLTGVESTDISGLAEEIALIRIYTRCLIESFDPNGDFHQHADLLRILCVASSAITRIIRAQYLISSTGSGIDDEIAEAIRQVNAEFQAKLVPPVPDSSLDGS